MKDSEILRAAAKRIGTRNAWAVGSLALDMFGKAVPPNSVDAQCWCAVGAMCAAVDEYHVTPQIRCVARRVRDMLEWPDGLGDWNDMAGREHAEVIAALTKAAELAESEGQ